jgi:hypothetical protein
VCIGLARACLALGCVALALAAWWSWPRTARAAAGAPLRLVLVDASRSVRATRPDWPTWLARELARQEREAHARGEELACLAFARDAEVLLEPGRATNLSASQLARQMPQQGAAQSASELAAALDLGEHVRARRGSAGGTLALLGGASFTGADPAARFDAFARAGFAFEHRAPPAELAERALGELELPLRVRAGERVPVRVQIHASASADVTLRVRAHWDGGESEFRVRAPAPPGAPVDPDGLRSWWAAFELGPCGDPVRGAGRVVLDVCAEPPDAAEGACSADGRGAHARSTEFVCGAAPLVVVAGDEEVAGVVARALAAPGALHVERAASRELANRLALADALVTCDVAPTELPAAELAAFVRGGGGWCALAGERTAAAFETRVPGRANALELLPLVPPRTAAPPRDIVFLVDGSGSMAGETQLALARALGDVLALLGPRETAEFRWFAGALGPALCCAGTDGAEARAAFARALVAQHPPGGPTRLASALSEWLASRTASAPEALVFVFGDGHESDSAGALERARALSERARAARVRIACVAVGDDVDDEFLGALLAPDLALERADDLGSPVARARLAQLFARELGAARRAPDGDHAVRGADAARLDPGAASVLAAQRALRAEPWPHVASFLRASVADGADVLWQTQDGAPLLAVQRTGLGHTAASAFAPGTAARAWNEDAWTLCAPLAAWLASAHADESLTLRTQGGELVLTARARTLPARVRARVEPWTELDTRTGLDGAPARADRRGAEVTFELAPETASGAARAEWRARWPAELDGEFTAESGGDARRCAVTLALDPPRTLVATLPRAPEDRFPRTFWRAPGVAATDLRGAPAQGAAPGSDARALPALAAALVLLGLGGVFGLGDALRSRPRV